MVSALVLRGHAYTLAHVGDTRAWLLRGGEFAQLSQDHAFDHPDQKSRLTRAVGLDDRVRIEVFNSGTISESNGGGIGVRNTRERLRQLYGDAQRFELGNAAGGVLAWMTFPWREAV